MLVADGCGSSRAQRRHFDHIPPPVTFLVQAVMVSDTVVARAGASLAQFWGVALGVVPGGTVPVPDSAAVARGW